MANYTPVSIPDAGIANVAPATTAAGGDEFVYGGAHTVLEFNNTHTAPITVSVVPTVAALNSAAGEVSTPTRSVTVPNGEIGVLRFSPGNANPFVNAAGRIPVTYTGHNAALKVRAYEVRS